MAKQQRRKRSTPREKTIVVPMAVRVSVELYDRFMNAVYALSGPPERLGYAKAMRTAIEREVARLERRYNKGSAFPQRRL